MGSNSTRGMDICLCFYAVVALCRDRPCDGPLSRSRKLPDVHRQHHETRKAEGSRPDWPVVPYKVSLPIFNLEKNSLAGLKDP
jgi:hypothetical protein